MFILADRVKESSLTEGNVDHIVLNDTFGGFQSFLEAIGDGNTTYYTIENNDEFEVGIGTYHETGNKITRDRVLDSSNNGARISLLGVSVVFCTYPADQAFVLNPSGIATAQFPHFSGIAFPDSGIQYHAINGSGAANLITVWDGPRSLSADPSFGWNASTNTLSVSGIANFYSDVSVSGNFFVTGTQYVSNTEIINTAVSGSTFTDAIFRREDAGSFFHAYVDNAFDNMVALYSTNEECNEWRLGIKGFSPSFDAPPTKGYVFGDCNSVGGVATYIDNFYILKDSTGFNIRHRNADLFELTRAGGLNVKNDASTAVPVTFKGAASQSVNLTEWQNYNNSVLAYINNLGEAHFPAIIFEDDTKQTTAYTQNYRIVDQDTNLVNTDDLVFVNTVSDIDVYLPSASGIGGKKITVKRTEYSSVSDHYIVRVFPSTQVTPAQTIDGLNSFIMNYHNESLTFASDNSNWHVI